MKVGILVAMDSEFRCLTDAMGGLTEGRFPNSHTDVVIRQCGIGKVNAAVGTMKLINQYAPDCILSTGLAGGVGEKLDVWDVVISTETAYHDVDCGMGNLAGQVQGMPPRFEADAKLLEVAQEACQSEDIAPAKPLTGLICTGDQFITTEPPIKHLLQLFPDALACDMESAAIAQVCYIMGVPFISLRTISDTPGRTSDHALQWEQSLSLMSRHSFAIVRRFIQLLRPF